MSMGCLGCNSIQECFSLLFLLAGWRAGGRVEGNLSILEATFQAKCSSNFNIFSTKLFTGCSSKEDLDGKNVIGTQMEFAVAEISCFFCCP